jgi:hypothetical protein
MASLIRPKKLKLTFPWHKSKRSSSAPISPVDRDSEGVVDAPTATIGSIGISRITSEDGAIHDAFRLAHEEEVNQESVVRDLENRITEFKRKVSSYIPSFRVISQCVSSERCARQRRVHRQPLMDAAEADS